MAMITVKHLTFQYESIDDPFPSTRTGTADSSEKTAMEKRPF